MFRTQQQIGDYILIRRLGRGGFGEVWLAERDNNGETNQVAMKLPVNESVDWRSVTQEIGLWVLCGKHPNVLPFIEARIFNGQIAIISEFVPDGSLKNLLVERGRFNVKEAIEKTIGILEGLNHLHSSSIIHRDLKPDNILIHNQQPRLADFGISRVITESGKSEVVAGTHAYMAPETYDGKRTVQTDIWAVGVMLYEMLEGSLPFPQGSKLELMSAVMFHPPAEFISIEPPEIRKIILKTLEKKSENRHQSALELRDDLIAFLGQMNRPRRTSKKAVRIFIPFQQKGKWGFCDQNRNIMIEPKYGQASLFKEDLASVELAGKYGFIDNFDDPIIDFKYDSAWDFSEGMAKIKIRHKFGFINKKGEDVGLIIFDDADSFSEGLASVKIKGKRGFINKNANKVIPMIFDVADSFSEGLAAVEMDGKWGYINQLGEIVIDYRFEFAGRFIEGVAPVKLDGVYGFIDKTGEAVLPYIYNHAGNFKNGLAWVNQYGRSMFIDSSGKTVLPIHYDFADAFNEGMARVRESWQWGFIDESGREVIPVSYDFASDFQNGLAKVRKDNQFGYISLSGVEYFNF